MGGGDLLDGREGLGLNYFASNMDCIDDVALHGAAELSGN